MDNFVVVLPSFGFVGKKTTVLCEEFLPVAGDVLHSQVVDNEFFTSVRRTRKESQNSCTHIINKTTPCGALPGGDLLCEGIVLFCKLQKSSKDTEEAKSHLFPGLKFLS